MSRIMSEVRALAKEDERIRWVMLTGSRANQLIDADPYQDYDIQMGVNDLESFLENEDWLERFGERAIMQKPEAMTLFEPSLSGRFTFLMQFIDGSRLDLMLVPLDKTYPLDSISKVLLDKDERLDMSQAKPILYWDTSNNVLDCMNEFLWLSYYVVKGINRKQYLYALDHLGTMRTMVLQMLAWKDGGNPGLSFKYLEARLEAEDRELIYKSYQFESIIESMLGLFEVMERAASTFEYNRKEFSLVRSQHQKNMV